MGEYGSFVHHDRQERLDAKRARRLLGQGPRLAARDVIRRRFPEFVIERDGQRCYDRYAVDALVALWAEHGKGHVTATMLRARHAEMLAEVAA